MATFMAGLFMIIAWCDVYNFVKSDFLNIIVLCVFSAASEHGDPLWQLGCESAGDHLLQSVPPRAASLCRDPISWIPQHPSTHPGPVPSRLSS